MLINLKSTRFFLNACFLCSWKGRCATSLTSLCLCYRFTELGPKTRCWHSVITKKKWCMQKKKSILVLLPTLPAGTLMPGLFVYMNSFRMMYACISFNLRVRLLFSYVLKSICHLKRNPEQSCIIIRRVHFSAVGYLVVFHGASGSESVSCVYVIVDHLSRSA